MEAKRKCSHAGFWITLILLAVLLFGSLGLNFLMGMALAIRPSGFAKFEERGEDEFPRLTEVWSYGKGRIKAARIEFNGVILRDTDENFFGVTYDPVESVLREVRAATHDREGRAILLEVDSPGGAITPSDEIYAALQRFKASRPGRKIVVFIRDMAASGGYYMASAGDWIIAEPTAMIGSIGVILQTLNWKGLSERIGLTDVTIKSGANKDLLNPFREVSPEQVGLLQAMLDDNFERFYGIVRASRKLNDEQLRPLADGRVFSATMALESGLIDQVGYFEDAVAKTYELLGEDSVKIIRYKSKRGLWDELFAEARAPFSLSRLARFTAPRLMYLWKP